MEVSEKSDIWYAVVNIFAASRKAGAMWGRAEAILNEFGVDYVAGRTGEGSNAMKLTFSACENGHRKFIAVGGDGTVHDVLEGIMSFLEACRIDGRSISLSDFTLSVIPLGSGNDWIKTAGIPHDIVKAASLFTEGKVSRQDVVKVRLLFLKRKLRMCRIWPMSAVWVLMRESASVSTGKSAVANVARYCMSQLCFTI